ncbi:MAG: xanthine dehydrogenase family protein molybdopterin-binding subunit [Alphaproteobacteria bacterium]
MAWKIFGTRAKRLEDPSLLRGRANFIDDIQFPAMLQAAFVRSPFAHAGVKGINIEAALAHPGVHAVLTMDDIRPHLINERLVVGMPSPSYKQNRDRPALAYDEVTYVGEPVAVIVAENRYIAEDAATKVDVDYDPLPASADCRDAMAPGAPVAHRDADHNLLAEFNMEYGDVSGAFAAATHVFSESLWIHRGGSHSIECRGCVASFDCAADEVTLWSSTQMPHSFRTTFTDMTGHDENQLRVITPDVGGGFGPKLVVYQEDIVLTLATRIINRPIKWVEDRREHFIATTQERDQYWEAEIAVDSEGKILGIKSDVIHDHGAFTARGVNLPYNAAETIPLPYEVPAFSTHVRLALTNKVPVTPVRGAGHPQGVFVMERLMDRVASELGIERDEVRRRNLIPGDKMPYEKPLKTRGGMPVLLDSGDYPLCQQSALDKADWSGFRTRQEKALAEGRYIGIGLANYVKGTGRGPFESVTVRIGPSGKIHVYTGGTAIGQGTRTMMAQIVGEKFGGDMENITVTAGDTGTISLGIGTSNSRLAVVAGSSAHVAAEKVREKALKVAAHMLEAAEEDLEIENGGIHVRGIPELKVTLGQVAHAVAGTPGYALPGGIEPGMEATEHVVLDNLAFACGTAVVEVEVDIETGGVEVLKYVISHDSGTIINPMIVDGQVQGGTAHGIGNTLFEWMGYDADANPVTTNFAEYLLVSATEMPNIEIIHHESPSPLNPLGVKGVGECGVVPAPSAIISAVEDALKPFHIHLTRAPLMPSDIIQAIAKGKNQDAA